MRTTPQIPTNTEATILGRVLSDGRQELPPDLAEYLLSVAFSEEDRSRMHELAERNQAGTLSAQEKDELLGYANAGFVLGMLQSQARRVLKKSRRVLSR